MNNNTEINLKNGSKLTVCMLLVQRMSKPRLFQVVDTTQQCTLVTNGSHHIDQHKGNLESINKALLAPEQDIRIF
jgi:hypothetical protein